MHLIKLPAGSTPESSARVGKGQAMRYEPSRRIRVCCGVEAIKLATAFRPDVVLLDLAMPDMTGYVVARELRRIGATKNSLTVAVTGFARQSIGFACSGLVRFAFVKQVDFAVIQHVRLLR